MLCRVNCGQCLPGNTHYCRICKQHDVSHRSSNCPSKITSLTSLTNITNLKNCRVNGCTSCLPGNTHYCKTCKQNDVTHRSSNCPSKQQTITQSNNIFTFQSQPIIASRLSTITSTSMTPITVSTVTVIWNDNGINKVLVGLRGVAGPSFGKVFTFGGSIDSGETKEDGAIRESFEEGGITIKKEHLKLLDTYKNFANFYVYYDRKPKVLGPIPKCQWEIIQSMKLQNDFGVSMITKADGSNSGLAWIPVDLLLSSNLDYVKNSSSIKIIQRMKNNGKI